MGEEEDLELEMILARKKRELMMRAAEIERKDEGERDPVEIVKGVLYDRGDEVLDAALDQYPEETMVIVRRMAELIEGGQMGAGERISGRQLLWLFRQLGMDVRLKSKILVEKDGKLVPLVEAMKGDE